MSSVRFIGVVGMAQITAARAVAGGNSIDLIGRDAAKAKGLAAELGGGATAGTFGAVPAGDIVVLAVPYSNAVQVIAHYGDALAGKGVIDISSTFNADATGVLTPDGISGAQEIAKVAPASAHVVKAFNTVFGHVLAQWRPLDVFFAGNDEQAKVGIADLQTALDLITGRPFDAGRGKGYAWLACDVWEHNYTAMIDDIAHLAAVFYLAQGDGTAALSEAQAALSEAQAALRGGVGSDTPLVGCAAALRSLGMDNEADQRIQQILDTHEDIYEEDLSDRIDRLLGPGGWQANKRQSASL